MSLWCELTIQRLSGAEGRPIGEADMPAEILDLQRLGSWDGIHIYPDAEPGPDGHWQFPRLSVGWEPEGRGYIVQCFETAASSSFFLSTSAALSAPEVYNELDGANQELWPKELFPPYDLALSAIRHFLSTGLQDPARAWVGISSFQRKTVSRRP